MADCKFAAACGGGHSTVEHWMHVQERRIKDACGLEAYRDIKDAVDELVRRRKADKTEYRIENQLNDFWVEYDTTSDLRDARLTVKYLRNCGVPVRVFEVVSSEREVDIDKV